jgi:CubicO group peptidase (beta-lactamase class C family)
MPVDFTPSADDAPNDDRNHPRRRSHDLDLDERSLERRLGAPIRRLLRQRRIAGACLCVVKVPMDPRASRTEIDGGIREYSQVYGVASLDVPGGTEVNATSKAPGRDDENVKKRMANNYGEEVDPRVTLFDVGSCAKIFPAIAIARESGIDLDDDADDHLPTELAVAFMATNASTKLPNANANPNDAKPVTVGDLLRHTGGIVDVTGGLTGEAYTRVQRQLLDESASPAVSLIARTQRDTPAMKRARLARITRCVGKALEAGAKRVECDHNLDLAASIVERVSGIEYERYVIDELRVGVKDAVSRTEPSALRNAYSALCARTSGDALDDDWNRGGVRAGRYVVELTNDAGDLQNGRRALVRRKASRRDPDGSSAAIEPNGNVWMTPWEMSRCIRGFLAPGTFVDTQRGVDDLVGDAVFSWHGVDGAFETHGSGFAVETTAAGLQRRPVRSIDKSRYSHCVYASSDDSAGADSILALFPECGVGVWIATNTREEWCASAGARPGGENVVWDEPFRDGFDGDGLSDGLRDEDGSSDGGSWRDEDVLKFRSGPGEGPGGRPRFTEVVLSMFMDEFILPGSSPSSEKTFEVEKTFGGTVRSPLEPLVASSKTRDDVTMSGQDGRHGSGLRIRSDLPGCD